jgi:hypothetical protein
MDDGDFVFDPESDRYSCPAGKKLVQFWRTYVAQERHNTQGDRGNGVDRDREGAGREQAARIDWRREE